MKAIIHIGTEKTGTTSIQKFLYQNRKKLKSAGYHFLQSAGKKNNRALPAYFVRDERYDDFFRDEGIVTDEAREKFRKQFMVNFKKELSSLPARIKAVVISSEHFHSRLRTEEELDELHGFLCQHFDEFKIICYLRDQVSTCTSYYSTAMKSGNDSSFAEFLQRCKPENYYFNYLEVLNNWERCFGFDALDVSLFRRDLFENGSLLDDFTSKIDRSLVGSLNTDVQIENESLTPTGQALARAVNLAFPVRTSRPELLPLREECKKNIYQTCTGTGRQPSLALQREIFEGFVEVNEALRQKFFPDIEVLFEPPSREPTLAFGVDEDFISGLMHILKIINTEGKDVILDEEYPAVYRNIMRCVTDLTQVEGGKAKEGREAIISINDIRLLRSTAKMIEQRDLKKARELLELVNEITPSLPGVKEKLEEYSRRVDRSHMPQFIISFSASPETLAEAEHNGIKEQWHEWLASLQDNIVGSTVNSLSSFRIVGNDGAVSEPPDRQPTGFIVLRAESAEEAYAIASTQPLLSVGGTVEIAEWMSLTPHD